MLSIRRAIIVIATIALSLIVSCRQAERAATPTATAIPVPKEAVHADVSPTDIPAPEATKPPTEDNPAQTRQNTLDSLQKIHEHPFYVMRYYGDYSFDDYLQEGLEINAQSNNQAQEESWACTCFAGLNEKGESLFGRNFDWDADHPMLLLFTEPPNAYASVTMVDISYLGFDDSGLIPIEEREALLRAPFMPFDGMNEHGLVVGMMAVSHADGVSDPQKVSISGLQAIRLMLDYAKDVAEAIALLQEYNVYFGPNNVPLHYLIADASGNSAVIEFIDGEMNVIQNEDPWQVSTNFIISQVKPQGANAPSRRYNRAYETLEQAGGRLSQAEAMNLLSNVAQSGGASTIWSTVYNTATGDFQVAVDREYDQVYEFNLKMQGSAAEDSKISSKEEPHWPTDGWRSSTPEQQGMDSEMLAEMFAAIQEQGHNIDSVTVARHGYLVADAAISPFRPDSKHTINSCTKSVVSALIGIAIDKGYIERVEQPLLDFFPERSAANLDANKKAITLEDVLTMATGLECRDSYLYRWRGLDQMRATDDWIQFMLDLPMAETPGSRFEYCNGASFLLSAIIQKSTGVTAQAFAEEHLFAPLGISDVEWPENPQGISIGWGGIEMRPRDMAKIGYLYLNEGRWDGEQIVPAEWVKTSTQKHIPATLQDGYGYQWWMADDGVYMALGYAGQYILVAPEKEMVVVFTGDLEERDFYTPQNLLNDFIIPAAKSSAPLPANPDGVAQLEAIIDALAKP